jgi:hypothetical protein
MVKVVGFIPLIELEGLPLTPSLDEGIFTTTGRTDVPPFCPNFLISSNGSGGTAGDDAELLLDLTLIIDGLAF